MSIAEQKSRERTEREGWNAVTIRRLADEIEYSQPVLYSHFANRDAIVAAVAIEGFREIAAALRKAACGKALEKVATAYLEFALRHPVLYEAMFTLPTDLHFADAETRPELREAFDALAASVKPFCFDTQADVATETFWAALHGLVELDRSGRIRPEAREERVRFGRLSLRGTV